MLALPIAVGVFFGVFMPYGQGLNFLAPWQMFVFAVGPAAFVGGAGWRVALKAFAWGMGIYVADLLYVSATHWHGRLLLPDPRFAFSVGLLGLTACLIASSVPKWHMRFVSAALIGIAAFWTSIAPDALRNAAALLLVSEWLPLYTVLLCSPLLMGLRMRIWRVRPSNA